MQRRFHTVLRAVKSPANVGLIVRQHAAFAGGRLIFVGERPWQFSKSSRAFSRRMEALCEIVHLANDSDLFQWARRSGVHLAAVEIDRRAQPLPAFAFPEETAIVVGNERDGLPVEFLNRCDTVVKIPQYGPVACLNVAASAIIAMYELRRAEATTLAISGAKYDVPATTLEFD